MRKEVISVCNLIQGDTLTSGAIVQRITCYPMNPDRTTKLPPEYVLIEYFGADKLHHATIERIDAQVTILR